MKKRLLMVLLAAFLIQACSSGPNNSNQIDYATLDSLQTEVVMEIGETDEYLPGQLRDVVVTSEGDILISDWASVTIEQFDAEGKHIATVAKEGGGPGELSNYFFMRGIGNDTLLVRHQSGQRSFYAPAENGIYQFNVSKVADSRPDRPVSIIGSATDTTYYATVSNVITNIQDAAKNEIDYRSTTLVTANVEGEIIEDSLHQLQTPTSHIVQVGGGGISMYTLPYRFRDRFIPLDNGDYLIARPDSNSITFYNRNHEVQRRLSLTIQQRPITDADLEYELSDTDQKIRNEIEARMHEVKPPYLNVWATDQHIWLYTDSGEAGKQMVVLDFEGNAIGKFMLPEVDFIQQIKGNKVYTIHRSPDRGHMVRVYQVNI